MPQAQRDVITVLMNDHRTVEGVLQELESGNTDAHQRHDLVDHMIAELVRHSVVEEQYLYPAARRWLANGDEIAEHEIAEHAEAERVMHDLVGRDPGDPQYENQLRTLITSIRHHVEDEEHDLFPRLRAAGSQHELDDLGRKIVHAKKRAPTRPHPETPDEPPANKILDPGAGLIDRIRDVMQKRST